MFKKIVFIRQLDSEGKVALTKAVREMATFKLEGN